MQAKPRNRFGLAEVDSGYCAFFETGGHWRRLGCGEEHGLKAGADGN
jgi:hypothetical protein